MIYRIREGKVVYELIEPDQSKDLKKGVIVFSGIPNQPRNEEFGENLAAEGFYVLQPRYIGNWESYGKFSINNCIKTVIEAEKLFSKGEAIECYAEKKIKWDIKDIYIIGSSFAPTLILSALPKLKTKNIVCLCPLTNLNKHNSDPNIPEQDLTNLYGFLKRGFENAFRGLSEEDWKMFITGQSKANPIEYAKKIRNKNILLIHGDNDKTINISRTKEYYDKIKEKNNVEFKIYQGIGHGKELRKISYDFILKWLKQPLVKDWWNSS